MYLNDHKCVLWVVFFMDRQSGEGVCWVFLEEVRIGDVDNTWHYPWSLSLSELAIASCFGSTCRGPGCCGGAAVAPEQQLDQGQSQGSGPIREEPGAACPRALELGLSKGLTKLCPSLDFSKRNKGQK